MKHLNRDVIIVILKVFFRRRVIKWVVLVFPLFLVQNQSIFHLILSFCLAFLVIVFTMVIIATFTHQLQLLPTHLISTITTLTIPLRSTLIILRTQVHP